MLIVKDKKQIEAIDIFPRIDDFILYLKDKYNIINFNNTNIKSSIENIYNRLINDNDKIRYLRLHKWLPRQFGFKKHNKFTIDFWIEKGFDEIDYINYKKSIIRKPSTLLLEKRKDLFIYDPNYSNLFKFNTYTFESNTLPNCNTCNNILNVKKISSNNLKIYNIIGCSYNDCISNNIKKRDIRIRSFLPIEKYNEVKKYMKSIKRAFCKDFWIKKGYSEEDAIEKVRQIQSENNKKFTGVRQKITREYLVSKGYDKDKIDDILSTPSQVKFWTKKGYTEEEARLRISKTQSYIAKQNNHENRILPSNIQYWINKGYNEEDAKKLVSKSQTTFSKEICIEKYGLEKGLEIFNERQRKWLDSLKYNGNIFIGYSKISQELFIEIKNRINREFKFAESDGEFKIEKDSGGYYFYDFTDIENKKIIEYNGDMYHANPEIYESNDNPHPFRKNIKSEEIWKKDQLKINKAKEYGFDVLIIWDSEYRDKGIDNKEKVIQKCINFLINN